MFTTRTRLSSSGNNNLPPSPPSLPVIGNLHQLGTHPHRFLRALSDKYGPLMFMHLGQVPTLIVSSADMVKEIIKTHDIVFSNRPNTLGAEIMLYGGKDVAFSSYGEYWRLARKVSVVELLSLKRVKLFQYVREEEVDLLISIIRKACCFEGSVNLSKMLIATSNNIVARCMLGQRVEDENGQSRFGELSRKIMVDFMAFSVGDFFPFLRWVDVLRGLNGRFTASSKALDSFFDKVIQEHKAVMKSNDGSGQNLKDDFVDILLRVQEEENLTLEHLKAILLDMFVGGSDTTSTALEWLMAELLRNPRVMKKAQEEVRKVVGNKSKIDPNDINKMSYLSCVIKENQRLHPSLPLLLPRETSASVEVGGYHVPAKTRVFINAWAIQRDRSIWEKPEEFIPERFENNPIDLKGQDHHDLVVFGCGRRACPGMSFAMASMEYVAANLLYWFDWELFGNGSSSDLDMSEVYGLSVSKKMALHVVPKPYSP
ncbi:phenylacetaldehyde oxime monooxygenase CYP71AN24-like [Humulus lupulus]|uniref:phenylacetaldehyde oxime monooxygenase CYP71AN24-like n=1 Tax=Humulus lupulus TaxID=3486 RepID=UPI002B4126E3|nr:phenylacetaldehyde oxime monooxygenase CYP71AN24-like [Humulus lupulus]